MKRPAFQFYPADWRKDAALQSCSLPARGLWHEMLCLMHECEPYGHMAVNGKPMKPAQIARLVGITEKEYQKLLQELMDSGVPSIAEDGSIFSRRMVRDEHIRNVRAEAGKKGGNPNLVGNKVKQKDNQTSNQDGNLDLTPSSSSSSSLKTTTPNPADAGPAAKPKTPAIALQTFLDACKAKGERPLRDYQPLWDYAKGVGLDADFVALAWAEFCRRFRPGGAKEARRQKDWRLTFRNYVENNYFKLWAIDREGNYFLTTQGKQAEKFQESREAA